MTRKRINLNKIISVTVTLSLLLTIVSPGIFASENAGQNTFFDNNSIINSQYGQVTDSVDTGSNITVINIQDLHCHLQTQQNISNILKDIDKKTPINTIFVEGGYDNINFDLINNISDKKLREKIINKMLADGTLTGAEYYALTNNKENILKGIDDKTLHGANISRLSQIINKKENYAEVLKNISEEIKILNNKYLNKKNIKFSRIIEQYKNGKITTRKFYKTLLQYAKESNNKQTFENILPLFIADYPNISNYLNITNNNADINYNKLTAQMQNFLAKLKKELSYTQYKKLSSDTDKFSDISVLADFITKYCEQKNINLSKDFNELDKFIKDIQLKQNINPVELLEEEKQLINAVRLSLSDDNTEYEISCIADLFNYFEKYLNYELTAYEWKYFEENFDTFKYLYSKYCITDKIKDIKNDFDLINAYYQVNEERNSVFLKKILETEGQKVGWSEGLKQPRQTTTTKDTGLPREQSSLAMTDVKKKTIVVVAGGFHSQELKDELTAKKINSMTIMPNISTEIDTAKIEYEDYVKIQDKMLSQALALRIAASAPLAEQQEIIAKAALELLPDVSAKNIKYLEKVLRIKIDKIDATRYQINFEDNSEITIDTKETSPAQQKKINTVKKNINSLLTTTINLLPNKCFLSVFEPDVYSFVKSISLAFFNFNIYFSDGIIPEIIDAKLKESTIDGISLEAFSTFMPEVQAMLLERQQRNGRLEDWKSRNNDKAEGQKVGRSDGQKQQMTTTGTAEGQNVRGLEEWKSGDDKQQTTETTKDTGLPQAKTLAMTDEKTTTGTARDGGIEVSRDNDETATAGTARKRFARVYTKLNKNFKMKIPQEIVGALHLDDGQEFYITRLNNNTLIISKREEQLDELVKVVMDIRKDNSRRGNYTATRYVYPNTYDFKLGKGNTINVKILYRPEIYREPLTPEQMNDIVLMYDIREQELLEISKEQLAINDETAEGQKIGGLEDWKSGDDKQQTTETTKDTGLPQAKALAMTGETGTAEDQMIGGSEGQKQTRQTTRSNIQFTQQEQYGRHPRSFRNPIKFSIFTPSIKSKAKYQDLYKHSLETVYKVSAPIKALIGKDSEKVYYEIITHSKNKDFLFSIIREPRLDIKYKLMAFMYLKVNNYSVDDGTIDYLKSRFVDYMKKNILDNSFRTYRVIRNNFDLRAVATGIFLLVDYLSPEEKDKEMYKMISSSVFVKSNGGTLANAGMFFADANPLTIAHEIGHNILFNYDFRFNNDEKERITLHELFADVTANCFGEEIGIRKDTAGNILYELFDEETNNNTHFKMFQEEHDASRGFLNLLETRSASLLKRNVYWAEMAETMLEYILQKEYLRPNSTKTKSQKEILEDLFYYYFDTLRQRHIILRQEQDFVNDFLEKNSSAFSIIKDVLDDIREKSFPDYLDILNVFRNELVIPHSYLTKSRDKKKTFSYFSYDSYAKDMEDFISAVILSQPEQKNKIISIIQKKILSIQFFNFDALKILITLDILRNSNSLMTKQDIERELYHKLPFIPDRELYSVEDYYHIYDYFYLMDHSVIKDIFYHAAKVLDERNYSRITAGIRWRINESLRHRYSKDMSLYEKAPKILDVLKTALQKRTYFIREDIEKFLIIDILLTNLNSFLFDKERINYKLYKILNMIDFNKKPFFIISDYNQLISYLKQTNLLSAEHRIKILNFFGIRNFEKQQEIISAWEYPWIVLGMFFPKIRTGFKNQHNQDIEEKLSVLEQDTATKIKEIFNLSVEQVKDFSFFNKISTIAKILVNQHIRNYNMARHLMINNVYSTNRVDIFYRDLAYFDIYARYDKFTAGKHIEIFIAENTGFFKEKDLINTGLKVNGNIIWQVRTHDKRLIFVADNATIKEIAETLNGYKNINKRIKKLLGLKDSFNLRLNTFLLLDNEEIIALEDKNMTKTSREIDSEILQATVDTSDYIEMLASA